MQQENYVKRLDGVKIYSQLLEVRRTLAKQKINEVPMEFQVTEVKECCEGPLQKSWVVKRAFIS
ncbi:hypothetical protein D918_09469 [Trichuris suis]|nr:hypothetical protein D918_09469 [Trichuris suis]